MEPDDIKTVIEVVKTVADAIGAIIEIIDD